MKRRKFTKEFKEEAVRLSREDGRHQELQGVLVDQGAVTVRVLGVQAAEDLFGSLSLPDLRLSAGCGRGEATG